MTITGPTVILADDHPLFRAALRQNLLDIAPDAAIIDAGSFDALMNAMAAHADVDLVLLDLLMPSVDGLSSLQFLQDKFPALRVAVISTLSQRTWVRSMQALGAVGFIQKSVTPEILQEALRSLLAGSDWWAPLTPAALSTTNPAEQRLDRLSRQEMRVLLHLKEGRINRQIAEELSISESTVKAHVSAILQKLDLSTRTQAAVLVQRLLSAV